jgi:hypothetical protein
VKRQHEIFSRSFGFPRSGVVCVADTDPRIRPLDLGSGLIASKPSDFVDVILKATDKQVTEKGIAEAEAREDFVLSTDALNFWRIAWRCSVEWGTRGFDEQLSNEVREGICTARGYEMDDLDSAIQATKGRVRLPFGWTALDLAWMLAQREPLQLLDPSLAGRRVPTAIAGIAYHLQLFQDKEPILLPIDQLRLLLKQRKIVVSGAVQRLVEAKILDYADKSYHTGKAREFRFVGMSGEQFEKLEQRSAGS